MMPATSAQLAPSFAQVSKPWNTPRILRTSLWALAGLDFLLLLASIAGAHVHRSAMQTIGRDSAPSIIAAQRLKTSLAAMDASLANDLLSGDAATSAAANTYQRRRTEAAQALIDAAQNITYGREERDPIERLQLQLGEYEARVQRARDLHDEKSPGALAAYERAASLMDNVLLPAADELDAANNRHLEETYSRQRGYSILSRLSMLLFALALLGALIWVQGFVTSRTRRIFNLPLLGATLIALGFTLWSLTVLGIEERQLRIAKEDAFTSLRALWRARAIAYSANGDESRFLLDPAKAAAATEDFRRKVAMLVQLPDGITMGQFFTYGLNEHSGAGGYFGEELKNITFPGEREAAIDMTLVFARYLRIDGVIRDLEAAGRHSQAVALCLGTRPGGFNYAFAEFDDALGRTIAINQQAFDNAVETGFAALSGYDLKAAATALVIALLIAAGLMQRIAEYR